MHAVKQEDLDEETFEDDDFVAPAKKVQKQGSGATAGTSSKPRSAAGQAAKGSSGVEASTQPARARPGSGGSQPSSAQGSKGAGASRPASGGDNKSAGPSRPSTGGSGKAAQEKPAPKPRALVASTTKVSYRQPSSNASHSMKCPMCAAVELTGQMGHPMLWHQQHAGRGYWSHDYCRIEPLRMEA